MKRFFRVAAARWWIPFLVGLLAMGGGVVALRARNASITPQFEAQALYKVQQGNSGQRTEQSQDTLRSAVERAIEANQEVLRKGNATVTSDQENFSIVFAARDSEREAAADLAEQLRTNFVIAEFGAVQLEERMELLLAEAIEVSLALDALEPPVPTTVPEPVLDATTQARLDFLLIQVGALTSQSAKLVGDLVLAETGEDRNGTPSEIQSQIDSVKEKLAAIYTELETIPGYDPEMLEEAQAQGRSPGQTGQSGGQGQQVAGGGDGSREGASASPVQDAQTDVSIPEDESEIAPGFQQAALEDRYAQIKADYEELFVASLTGATGDLDPAEVRNTTPEILPLALGAGAGFGLGVLLAIASLFLIGRVRKPVWAPADIAPLPVLAEIPAAHGDPGKRLGRRPYNRHRRAIQDFRGSMIGMLASRTRPIAVGLEGVKTPSTAVNRLVDEVGASLQAADRNVLVMDVDFRPEESESPSAASPTMASLLELMRLDPEAASSQLKEVFNEAGRGPAGLRVVAAGYLDSEPSDVILARPFGQLLNEALTYADVVILRIPEAEVVADALYQRLDGVVAVCRARRATERDLVKLAVRLAERRADLIGAVLLRGRSRHFYPGRDGQTPTTRQGSKSQWLDRLDPRRLRGRLRPPHGRLAQKPEPKRQDEAITSDTTTARKGLRERSKDWISLPNRSRLARARVRLRVPTSQWRALPDFLVIGAQRAGTSSLYRYLGQHPSILPSIRKETEYFTRRHSFGESWYRAHFPIAERSTNGIRHLTFEADPSYLLDPRAPLRASDLVPDAKLIVVLRDPVARAISHYKHNRRIGLEQASLEEAIDREAERLAGEVERMWQDPSYPATQYLRYSYATRGLYAEQLERWLEFFPSSSLRIIKSEDLFRNTSQVYAGLLDFLEVAPWQPSEFGNASTTGTDNGEALSQAVVERLRSHFIPYNSRLYSLVGEDFGW